MIQGLVETPGCFLNASAVLERQFTAYVFDRWVETGVPEGACLQDAPGAGSWRKRGRAGGGVPRRTYLRFSSRTAPPWRMDSWPCLRRKLRITPAKGFSILPRGTDLDIAGRTSPEGLEEAAAERKTLRNRIQRSRRIRDMKRNPAKSELRGDAPAARGRRQR